MLKLTVIAMASAIFAVGAAKAVEAVTAAREPAAQIQQSAMVARAAPEPAADHAAQISKASDGHYWAEADVNGARVRFLVDTGATAVALTPEDALRLGFAPKDLEYRYTVTTAAGPARGAAIKLASVSVAGARVNDVDALVIEKGLDASLLGMTYLGRLSRFEATRSALILRP
ncbi:MAG: TIGR02281 family clan AA aspartic protease [Phenylobacterium sp.]|uniref:TIGR02281 family clan AA aspartic protease n=1 Tax=Phenylobacterium sp. TaxID=1871053 RepID=UPI0027338834|nr:TIGR02281 family clan AA aspartic protease [Phenylobacterium sp.]MDP3175831.1 TIGR02281 family clan AA aspartic protease [Phenylobacterium sp.]